jgi:hypothetical protein
VLNELISESEDVASLRLAVSHQTAVSLIPVSTGENNGWDPQPKRILARRNKFIFPAGNQTTIPQT